MDLFEPVFVRATADGTLHVSSGKGVVNQSVQVATFQDNVNLLREPASGKSKLRVQTEYMQVFMEKEFARTDRPVTITHGNSTLNGIGLEYDKKSNQFNLKSNVQGVFDARKK